MIRRVQISYPSGELRIISDNPKYEASEVEADKVGIFGKVIWYSRELER
jgi:phage repressor protein C with HTH and peptisase S24 domain